ncbi:MAG: MotA/TolQ/ExbB proton channel family protein [Proteobacteria bacterium]|nr:MotA/TolQ/ExbB proton channel family protein [Pseudomonadota bacterium]
MPSFLHLLLQTQSFLYFIILLLYFFWVLRRIRNKAIQLDSIASDVFTMEQIDPNNYVNMSKEAILESLPIKNKTLVNRFSLIVNYALAGIPYTHDVLEANEAEMLNIDDVTLDLNIFPLFGLLGTTAGLIFALVDITKSQSMSLNQLMAKIIPDMTLAFSSTLYACLFVIITYFFFVSPLRKRKESVVNALGAISLRFHMTLLKSKDVYKISEKFYESFDRLEAALRYIDEGVKDLNMISTNLMKFSQSFEKGAALFTDNQAYLDAQLQSIRQVVEELSKKTQAQVEQHCASFGSLVEVSKNFSDQQAQASRESIQAIDKSIQKSTELQTTTAERTVEAISRLQGMLDSFQTSDSEKQKFIADTLNKLAGQYDGFTQQSAQLLKTVENAAEKIGSQLVQATTNQTAELCHILKRLKDVTHVTAEAESTTTPPSEGGDLRDAISRLWDRFRK